MNTTVDGTQNLPAKTGKHPNSPKVKAEAKKARDGEVLVGFSYDQITDENIRAKAKETADAIKANNLGMEKAFLENGRRLLEIKDDLGHGHFTSWLEAEFKWSRRTANNYMTVALRLGDDYHEVAYLPSQTIYRLAAKHTPDRIVAKVVTAAKNGKPMTDEQVEEAVENAKPKKLPAAPKQIEGEVVSDTPAANNEPSPRHEASEKLLQLIAQDGLTEFLRLAPEAGIVLSPEFLAVAVPELKDAA